MKYRIAYLAILHVLFFTACNKLVQIPPPVNTITTSQVFSSDAQATSAMAGVYSNLINNGGYPVFGNGGVTIHAGLSSDELLIFARSNSYYLQYQDNALQSSNPYLQNFWNPAYTAIYGANSVIEGLQITTGVHDSVKNELIGEAEFTRAFCNFYLVNLFGAIPLVTTVNWHFTNTLARTAPAQVYQAMVNDLLDAQKRLPGDYSVGQDQRIIPNKWAATALLARVYLYINNYAAADSMASSIINNTGLYQLTQDPNQAFLMNSTEAIWQLQQSLTSFTYNATNEGFTFVPYDSTAQPFAILPASLLNAFENGDLRKAAWVDSINYNGTGQIYYFPYKYKIGPAQSNPSAPYTEYYMVLRLAEQILIRAEARAFENNLTGAINDLNTIRGRATLAPLPMNLSQSQVIAAIAQERRVELFDEWGHRWFDLKRTGQATAILSPIKPLWKLSAELFPIPYSETITDPNLTQNPGY